MFVLWLAYFCQPPTINQSLAFRIFFIKSAVDQKSLKLGVVIAWNISIVQNISIAIATCLVEFLFGPYFAKGL